MNTKIIAIYTRAQTQISINFLMHLKICFQQQLFPRKKYYIFLLLVTRNGSLDFKPHGDKIDEDNLEADNSERGVRRHLELNYRFL